MVDVKLCASSPVAESM